MQIKFDANKKRLDTTPAFGLLVQGENLAESIQITGPKMVGALDLSQLRVAVRMTSAEYETTVEKTLEQTTDGDTITLIWEVDKQFTGSPGKVDVMLVGYGGNEEVIKITSSGMVVQEDKVFGTAPPESTWEQILQQMQDFATQAYESKTAAANSAAAAAASQKVAEEKAAQATNAADTAVAAAKTAAEDAAAQAAAKTEQQIRQYADDRYARPLVTKTGPAASLEVYPDKLSNLKVYANGFTQQAGTGDPSPSNVRQLTNGGLRMVKVVFDGTENWAPATSAPGAGPAFAVQNVPNPKSGANEAFASTTQFCTDCPIKNAGGYSGECIWVYGTERGSGIRARLFGAQSAEQLKTMLAARYAAGNPVTVWYAPADESQATGLYAPIILTSGEYRATCLPLTAPLCEGDSVVSLAKSGGDKTLVLDGTKNFLVDPASTFSDVIRFSIQLSDANTSSPVVFSERFTPSTVSTLNSEYIGITDIGKLIGAVYKSRLSSQDTEGVKAYFAAHPLTVWYRSANYTEAADIAVSLETHQQAVLVLDGTESVVLYWNGRRDQQLANGRLTFSVAGQAFQNGNAAKCSHFAYYNGVTGGVGNQVGFQPEATNRFYFCMDLSTIGASASDIDETLQSKVYAYLAAQYAAGTPVTIVYQLATPITYAHEAVVLPALPDDTGKVKITGQSGGTVTVVFNKSIIKEIAEIKAAMLAMGANLSM